MKSSQKNRITKVALYGIPYGGASAGLGALAKLQVANGCRRRICLHLYVGIFTFYDKGICDPD